VAGLLLAAPYAAIMSTVAAFLLMISSSLVRDLYQRTINPNVSPRAIKAASYLATGLVGVVVMVGALNPPGFLQYIIVFTGTGQGCSFLAPMFLALYWRRATRQGMLAGMLGGFAVVLGLYALGWLDSANWPAFESMLGWFPGWGESRPDKFAPLYAGGVDPLVWGLLMSVGLSVGVSLATRPEPELVRKYFP
jgi:Na+/proline symporter